jgi:hypothetical protein
MFTPPYIDSMAFCPIMESVSTGRDFYEQTYHYEEDITVPDTKRIARFFKDIRFIRDHKFLDIGCGTEILC